MSTFEIGLTKSVDYIPVDVSKIPYTFSIKLDDRTFTITIKYNSEAAFFTADLAITATGVLLCYGDPILYGRPMFRSIETEDFPLPVIIPFCLTGEESEVTLDNLGTTVQLYLHDRVVE
ncbi:MAG: phage baseplate plug family protein [Lachnospiraceae bacterium]